MPTVLTSKGRMNSQQVYRSSSLTDSFKKDLFSLIGDTLVPTLSSEAHPLEWEKGPTDS